MTTYYILGHVRAAGPTKIKVQTVHFGVYL